VSGLTFFPPEPAFYKFTKDAADSNGDAEMSVIPNPAVSSATTTTKAESTKPRRDNYKISLDASFVDPSTASMIRACEIKCELVDVFGPTSWFGCVAGKAHGVATVIVNAKSQSQTGGKKKKTLIYR